METTEIIRYTSHLSFRKHILTKNKERRRANDPINISASFVKYDKEVGRIKRASKKVVREARANSFFSPRISRNYVLSTENSNESLQRTQRDLSLINTALATPMNALSPNSNIFVSDKYAK